MNPLAPVRRQVAPSNRTELPARSSPLDETASIGRPLDHEALVSDLELVARWARSLAIAARQTARSESALRAELALLEPHLGRVATDHGGHTP
jgi:hypothetical protein